MGLAPSALLHCNGPRMLKSACRFASVTRFYTIPNDNVRKQKLGMALQARHRKDCAAPDFCEDFHMKNRRKSGNTSADTICPEVCITSFYALCECSTPSSNGIAKSRVSTKIDDALRMV